MTYYFELSVSLLSILASMVEFLNQISEEKSSLPKLVEHNYFIYAMIYSFSSKHEFKLKFQHKLFTHPAMDASSTLSAL